ncbi:hypothetical protein [Acinetobacter phage Ab69]|nr:hypothetical protein [Acinetobacter phage Ab69]
MLSSKLQSGIFSPFQPLTLSSQFSFDHIQPHTMKYDHFRIISKT